jgi:hypothetical protein
MPALADLDVESAQIVNLALNLSESRRNASGETSYSLRCQDLPTA